MTIQELYDWAKHNNIENLEIGLQYQDGGGVYYGDTFQDGENCGAKLEESGGQQYILLY